MKYCMHALGVLAVATSLSFAQEPPKKPGGPGGQRATPEERFKKLDTNSDGALSLEEWKASPMAQRDATKAEAAYKKVDADGDGKVTLEEFKAHRPARPGGGRKGGGGGKGGGGAPPPPKPAE